MSTRAEVRLAKERAARFTGRQEKRLRKILRETVPDLEPTGFEILVEQAREAITLKGYYQVPEVLTGGTVRLVTDNMLAFPRVDDMARRFRRNR